MSEKHYNNAAGELCFVGDGGEGDPAKVDEAPEEEYVIRPDGPGEGKFYEIEEDITEEEAKDNAEIEAYRDASEMTEVKD